MDAFGWIKRKKRDPLRVDSQLPNRDWQELSRLWDSTDRMLESQRYEDQADFKNAERQMGKPLHHSELVRRILLMNSQLIVQDSTTIRGNAAFYFVNPDKTLAYTNASFEKGIVPEFTIIKTDTADLPSYYPRYGWRTVLVRLIKGKYISLSEAIKVFGDVEHNDTRGKHWALNIRKFR